MLTDPKNNPKQGFIITSLGFQFCFTKRFKNYGPETVSRSGGCCELETCGLTHDPRRDFMITSLGFSRRSEEQLQIYNPEPSVNQVGAALIRYEWIDMNHNPRWDFMMISI